MKYSVKLISYVFFLFYIVGLSAQTPAVDSLETILQKHTTKDTTRVNLLNDLAYELYFSDLELTLKYAQEAYDISKDLEFEKGEARSLILIGIYYDEKSDFMNALIYYNRALHIYEKLNDKQGLTKCYNNIGVVHRYQGDYFRALEYYQKSLKIAEEQGDRSGVSYSLNNIGIVYFYIEDYSKAREYYEKSLSIDEELGDKNGVAYSLNNIGIIYEFQSNFPKALEYYQKSLVIKEEIDNKSGLAKGLNNIAAIYMHLKDYENAYVCYQKSLRINEDLGKKSTEAYSYIGLASLSSSQNNFREAYNYASHAYFLANEVGNTELIKESAEVLAKASSALGKYEDAYKFHVVYKNLSDSIFNEKNIKRIAGLEYQFKYNKEKELAQLAQKRKEELLLERDRRLGVVLNAFLIGFVLMVLIVIIIFRNLLQKRKTNKLLEKQKEDIESRNRALFAKNDEVQEKSEMLELANQKLIKVNAEKDKFFSIISHDLKSPFNAILGYSGLLSRNYNKFDDIKRKEMIEGMNISANSAFMLLEDLLTWSRTQLGRVDFLPEKLNLNELIDDTIYHLQGQANNKGLKILNEVPESIEVFADRNMISAILRNLVSNGLKFTHKGGEIRIGAEKKDHEIIVSVSDTGIGITEDKLKNIFELTNKSKTIGTNNEKGTGLGLILCKEFVEQHGGEIYVESEKDVGSTFSFTIPHPK
jgi:signal transduction histidine kinase/Tfp pilus assembly protein PilF